MRMNVWREREKSILLMRLMVREWKSRVESLKRERKNSREKRK
jgi:hypothetical protein